MQNTRGGSITYNISISEAYLGVRSYSKASILKDERRYNNYVYERERERERERDVLT